MIWQVRYHVQQPGCCGNPPFWVERIETVQSETQLQAEEKIKKQYTTVRIIEINPQ